MKDAKYISDKRKIVGLPPKKSQFEKQVTKVLENPLPGESFNDFVNRNIKKIAQLGILN